MTGLDAMPDFSRPLGGGEAMAFQSFGGGDVYQVLLGGLELALDGAGRPRFQLVLEQSADLTDASGQFAVLDIELAARYPLDEALAFARQGAPSASASAAPIDLGFARLVPAGAAVGLSAAALAPVPLGWSTADGARWTMRIDSDSAGLIKGALSGGALLLGARLEFTVLGVTPRMSAKATFDPAALLAGALKGAGAGRIAAPDLLAHLSQPADALGVTITGDANVGLLPQVLADRLFAAYGALAPATAAEGPVTIAFTPPSSGAVSWDLGEPVAAPRGFVLRFDLLSALRQAKAADCVRELVIPPLDLGFRQVTLAANLPANRAGVPAMGARLDMPPAPPARPSAISETATFAAPDDQAVIKLRLGPDEPLTYRLTCFAIVAAGADVRQWESPARTLSDPWLQLQASDFPLAFAHLTASPRLLALTSLSGELTYQLGAASVRQPIRLDTSSPDIAVALPSEAHAGAINLSATAIDGGQTIALTPLEIGRTLLDLPMFTAYGPHRVSIAYAFAPDDIDLVTVQLVGEDGANPGSVTLTPSSPTAEWGYVAASPFHAGYRYKQGGAEWSAVQAFDAPLKLASVAAPDEAVPTVIDGVHLYGAPDRPGTIFYVPANPTAEDDGAGHPAVSVIRTPALVILQVGARFTLTDDEQTRLLKQLPSAPAPSLQPAPIQVQKAALLLTEPDGTERELASSTSSLYPPFNAVFSASLDAADGARAISAVNGGQGLLFVDYTIGLPPAAAATYAGSPQTLVCRADLASWFPADGSSHVQIIG